MNAATLFSSPTNINSQQERVLKHLQTNAKGLNRFEADFLLNVCHLAGRIIELKQRGHLFDTVTESVTDTNGRIHHKIVRYFWNGSKTQSCSASHSMGLA